MRFGYIFQVEGVVTMYEVYAEQCMKYMAHESFELLGQGVHHEVGMIKLAEVVGYCRERGLEPVMVGERF